jgi:hypothetical protein
MTLQIAMMPMACAASSKTPALRRAIELSICMVEPVSGQSAILDEVVDDACICWLEFDCSISYARWTKFWSRYARNWNRTHSKCPATLIQLFNPCHSWRRLRQLCAFAQEQGMCRTGSEWSNKDVSGRAPMTSNPQKFLKARPGIWSVNVSTCLCLQFSRRYPGSSVKAARAACRTHILAS